MNKELVIVAKVTTMGSKSRVAGWRYCRYIYNPVTKTCKFDCALTYGMYPNKRNYTDAATLEASYKKCCIFVIGRPTHKRLVNLGIIKE